MSQYQTLSEFMRSPFGTPSMDKVTSYSSKYQEFRKDGKIKIVGYTIVEDAYYYHIRIPSESKDGKVSYDVVIRFFTDDESVKKENSLQNYFIQFFSNSPSFIYKYAVLYKQNGFLIEPLFNKMDQEFKDVLPEKTNPNMQLSYDKSIYFACRYLSEMKFRALSKHGMILQRRISNKTFFTNIQSFGYAKIDLLVASFEKRMERKNEELKSHYKKEKDSQKKKTVMNKNKLSSIVIKKAGMATNSFDRQSIHRKKKISAKKTTRKI